MTDPRPFRIEWQSVDTIPRAPRNPKDHDLGALHRSIARHGFTAPVMVDERTGRLVAGHGRVDAVMQLKADGKAAPAGVRVDGDAWLIPVIRGVAFNSDADAEAYLVADNRLVELGGYNDGILAAVLRDSIAANMIEFTGFDADDLGRIMKAIEGDAKMPNPPPPAEPPVPSECRVEIPCTKAQLAELYPTLEEWRARGVPVHISTT